MIEGLRQYEEQHPDKCSLLSSEDQFYGFGAKGKNLLERYVQWVFFSCGKRCLIRTT